MPKLLAPPSPDAASAPADVDERPRQPRQPAPSRVVAATMVVALLVLLTVIMELARLSA